MDRTWKNWTKLYLKADAKALLNHKGKGNVEQCGGLALAQKRDDPVGGRGRPTPVTMDDLKGCFESLATAAVTGKEHLADLVAVNLALTKVVVDLTNTNAYLMKNVESWTNNSDGGGSGDGGGGGGRPNDKWVKCEAQDMAQEG